MRCGIVGLGKTRMSVGLRVGRGLGPVDTLMDLWRDEAGVMTAETALMVALLSLASFATWRQLATTIDNTVADSVATLSER